MPEYYCKFPMSKVICTRLSLQRLFCRNYKAKVNTNRLLCTTHDSHTVTVIGFRWTSFTIFVTSFITTKLFQWNSNNAPVRYRVWPRKIIMQAQIFSNKLQFSSTTMTFCHLKQFTMYCICSVLVCLAVY